MYKLPTCTSIAVIMMVGAGTASAGGSQGTIGVGAELQLSGLGGLSMNYDAGNFHAGGFLSFEDEDGDDNSQLGFGGRFFWHIHSSPMSDFSFGGNLGILMSDEGPDESSTLVFLEPAVQIRAFIAGNVAISATSGIVIGISDAEGMAGLRGQVNAIAGIHYYFF